MSNTGIERCYEGRRPRARCILSTSCPHHPILPDWPCSSTHAHPCYRLPSPNKVLEEWTVKYKCALCPKDGWHVNEDGSSSKRHLLKKPHLDAAIAAGMITGHTSGEAVLAEIAALPPVDGKAEALTAAGRHANSKRGRALKATVMSLRLKLSPFLVVTVRWGLTVYTSPELV